MPLYEYQCAACGARDEVFTRTVLADIEPPSCPQAAGDPGHEMRRIVSTFARHSTMADKLVEAEAKFGKEVDAAMGPEPDVGKYARRYEQLSQGLPGDKG
ncbi:MAG: zinc ribbon domain-containing protein [Dehalococcoidia bacterium]|nr:zinc ribbon domain-containing protein [Dehalococcoidia bacterium]